eukprot:TRINITY_DN20_c1_g1_i4.p4 TRINITY_DN20_c1_g1~~TRINITY_DN20_c1_g1_i4.p4  ORF type:complete len:135 (+),score=4.28 TRINITY_DN20_c1_g1_i4:161-565(+)
MHACYPTSSVSSFFCLLAPCPRRRGVPGVERVRVQVAFAKETVSRGDLRRLEHAADAGCLRFVREVLELDGRDAWARCPRSSETEWSCLLLVRVGAAAGVLRRSGVRGVFAARPRSDAAQGRSVVLWQCCHDHA